MVLQDGRAVGEGVLGPRGTAREDPYLHSRLQVALPLDSEILYSAGLYRVVL